MRSEEGGKKPEEETRFTKEVKSMQVQRHRGVKQHEMLVSKSRENEATELGWTTSWRTL